MLSNVASLFSFAISVFGCEYDTFIVQDFTDDLEDLMYAVSSLKKLVDRENCPVELFSSLASIQEGLSWSVGVHKSVFVVSASTPARDMDFSTFDTEDASVYSGASYNVVWLTSPGKGRPRVLDTLASITGGKVIDSSTDNIADAVGETLVEMSNKPLAWFTGPGFGKTGESQTFNAQGSIDPMGGEIVSYHRDFERTNGYDYEYMTSSPEASYAFPDYMGFVRLKVVTADGRESIPTTALLIVNEDGGYPTPTCPINEENGNPITEYSDGSAFNCIIRDNENGSDEDGRGKGRNPEVEGGNSGNGKGRTKASKSKSKSKAKKADKKKVFD